MATLRSEARAWLELPLAIIPAPWAGLLLWLAVLDGLALVITSIIWVIERLV